MIRERWTADLLDSEYYLFSASGLKLDTSTVNLN